VRNGTSSMSSRTLNACLRTAYIHGLNFCSGDFVIIMDADFSHHVRCRRSPTTSIVSS
jgi:hypothetical protein